MSRVWHRNFFWSAPSYLAGAALAALATAAPSRGWFGWLALLAIPLYLVFRSYHTVVARLREEQDETRRAMDVQLATIEALALAIEAKAGCTPEHIRSIQQYAALLAEARGLSDAEVQAVRTAALLHDIGNMAVPEHILSKPDALTPEEFERVKIHPRVGADILRNVPFGAPVAISCSAITSAGMGWDIRRDCAARTFRSARASSRSPTASARCRPTVRTGPHATKRTRSAAARIRGHGVRPRARRAFIARLHATPAAVDAAGRAAWNDAQELERCRTSPARTAKSRRSTRSRRRSARAWAYPTRWR